MRLRLVAVGVFVVGISCGQGDGNALQDVSAAAELAQEACQAFADVYRSEGEDRFATTSGRERLGFANARASEAAAADVRFVDLERALASLVDAIDGKDMSRTALHLQRTQALCATGGSRDKVDESDPATSDSADVHPAN